MEASWTYLVAGARCALDLDVPAATFEALRARAAREAGSLTSESFVRVCTGAYVAEYAADGGAIRVFRETMAPVRLGPRALTVSVVSFELPAFPSLTGPPLSRETVQRTSATLPDGTRVVFEVRGTDPPRRVACVSSADGAWFDSKTFSPDTSIEC